MQQLEMFPDVRIRHLFPVTEIAPLLQRAERSFDGGRAELARVMALRVGGHEKNYNRLLNRIAMGHQHFLTLDLADRLAHGIGLHPINVWPQMWMAA